MDLHSLPHPGINLVVPLWACDSDLHSEPGHSDHDFISDVVGISNPCDLFAFQVGEWIN